MLSITDTQRLRAILQVLARIKGVRHSFYLTKGMRDGLALIEKEYPSIGPLRVRNDGVKACLKREHIACITKDKSFRSPPHSTVLLVNDDGDVIGRELLPGDKVRTGPTGRAIMLGKDFVVFYGKGSSKGAQFVLPAVPFKEVEDFDGTSRVVSCSPSTAGDHFLRKKAKIADDPKLASILIGFDLCKP